MQLSPLVALLSFSLACQSAVVQPPPSAPPTANTITIVATPPSPSATVQIAALGTPLSPAMQKLAAERLSVAMQYSALMKAQWLAGSGRAEDYFDSAREVFLAQRELHTGGALADDAAAYEHVMTVAQQSTQTRVQMGAVNSSEVLLVKMRLLEAQMWLEDAKSRQ